MKTSALVFLVLVLCSVLAVSCASQVEQKTKIGVSQSAEELSAVGIGRAEKGYAPDLVLRDLDGEEVKLSNFKGKVVILNFWATWAPSCMKEMAALEELKKAHEDALVVLGISVDSDGEDVVKAYIEKRKVTYPIIMATRSILDAYETAIDEPVDTIPATIIIDRGGFILKTLIGTQYKDVFQRTYESATPLR